jgi:integrase
MQTSSHVAQDANMSDLIEAHLAHLRAAGKSPHTIEDRSKLLRRLDRELPYGVDRAAVEEWESFLGQQRFAQWTRVAYWVHGNCYYRWLVHRGYLDWNPLGYIERPKAPVGVPHPVSDAQLEHVLARAGRPYRTAFLLAAYAGMRASEVAAATREQISEPLIRIHGKGDKTRVVPNHELILAELPHLPGGPIIARPNGLHYAGDNVSRMMSAYLTEIGLPQVTLHWFRHWFATTMLRGGREDAPDEQLRPMDLRTVQELMGHASPAVTMIYTKVSDRQRRLAICTLPVLHASTHQEAA